MIGFKKEREGEKEGKRKREGKKESYEFDFSNVPKPHESYNGIHVRLRYEVKVIFFSLFLF